MIRAFLALAFVELLTLSAAQASYRVYRTHSLPLDPDRRTHFMVTDRASDLGNAPRFAALSKARHLLKIYPDEQIVVISPEKSNDDVSFYRRNGFAYSDRGETALGPQELMTRLSKFNQIASINTFGHGAIPEGVFLDAIGSTDVRWRPYSADTHKLVGHFTPDAFVTLNGCNGGHVMAPSLAKLWGIPVSGAITGTHFEAAFPDGVFYSASPNQASLWQANAADTFRMRPDNANYRGHYGAYSQGLNFYKVFCVDIGKEKCMKGMAKMLVSSVVESRLNARPSFEEYSLAARQWLCPTSDFGGSTLKDCLQRLQALSFTALTAGDMAYTPFRGRMSNCTFHSCYAKEACTQSAANAWTCAKNEAAPTQSDTFVREYLAYLEAFRSL